jgi:hypothetical protein
MRRALLDQKSCFVLVTNELDNSALGAQEVLAAYKTQGAPERGFRFLKKPQFLASSLYLKSPSASWRLDGHGRVFVDIRRGVSPAPGPARAERDVSQPGRTPNTAPTAKWVFHCLVGIHVLLAQLISLWH